MKRGRFRLTAMFVIVALCATTLMPGSAFAAGSAASSTSDVSISQGGGAIDGSATTFASQKNGKKYKVTFNANGGKVKTKSKTVRNGKKYGTLPKNVKKTGATFLGWFTKKSGGVQILTSTIYTSKKNTTLYAHWKKNAYTVTFNSTPSAAVLKKKFREFYTTPGAVMFPVSIYQKKLSYGKKLGAISDTTQEVSGYLIGPKTQYGNKGAVLLFKGWYTKPSGKGQKVTPNTKVTKNMKVYADWELGVGMRFDANGGRIKVSYEYNSVWGGKYDNFTVRKGTALQSSTRIIVKKGAKIGKLPVATQSGYRFNGWWTAPVGGKKITSSTRPAMPKNGGYLVYYAHWK